MPQDVTEFMGNDRQQVVAVGNGHVDQRILAEAAAVVIDENSIGGRDQPEGSNAVQIGDHELDILNEGDFLSGSSRVLPGLGGDGDVRRQIGSRDRIDARFELRFCGSQCGRQRKSCSRIGDVDSRHVPERRDRASRFESDVQEAVASDVVGIQERQRAERAGDGVERLRSGRALDGHSNALVQPVRPRCHLDLVDAGVAFDSEDARSERGVPRMRVARAGFYLTNSGPLQIGGVAPLTMGIAVSAGDARIRASSPLTVAEDVIAIGGVFLKADESAGPGDDLTVNGDVIVRAVTEDAILEAGDNLTLLATSLVEAPAGEVNLKVDCDNGDLGGQTALIAGLINSADPPDPSIRETVVSIGSKRVPIAAPARRNALPAVMLLSPKLASMIAPLDIDSHSPTNRSREDLCQDQIPGSARHLADRPSPSMTGVRLIDVPGMLATSPCAIFSLKSP